MKKLNLLDQSTSFKVNDTGTIIPFNAFENNQPFGVTENETSVFRIKNDMGFLKAVNATSAAGGYIFQLNTKDLVGLVPGTYEIELVVTDTETNGELIFPDTGFCSFTITTSALTVTGTQIPTMSLDSFKQQLEQYVQTQTDTQTKQIKSDFDSYVASVKTGPQGEPGPSGKSATVLVGTTKTVDPSEPADVTNTGTGSNAILNFNIPRGAQGPQGEQGPIGATGPEGTIGDYVTGTGWLDLTPYMNTGDSGVWCGWNNNNTTGDIGQCKYAVTTINGQNIFWYRIHSRFLDASIAGKWGTKLFTIPSDVQTQYGGMEASQYQGGIYECNGQPCLIQVVGNIGSRYIQTRGAIQMSAGGDNTSKLTGIATVNMEGWYVL